MFAIKFLLFPAALLTAVYSKQSPLMVSDSDYALGKQITTK